MKSKSLDSDKKKALAISGLDDMLPYFKHQNWK